MRRPLKPFVTEYKGTNRRPKDGAGLFGAEPEISMTEAPARKTAEAKTTSSKSATRRGEAQRSGDSPRYGGAQPEDSYEAAMRAADALFSGAPAKDPGTSQSAPIAHDAFFKQEDAPRPGTETASTGTGRILRVLDEAPDAALLEMEAERTPKRRGRKPGSKNKPKVDSHALPSADIVSEQTYAYESRHDFSGEAAYPAPAKVAFFPPITTRGAERFAWVRTKLGPGEAWKRRLPKVIW